MEVPLITFDDSNRLTVDEYKKVRETSEQMLILNKRWRAGQSLMLALYRVKPRLADSIRTTSADPFYHNKAIPQFFKKICDDESYLLVDQNFK